MPIDPMRPASLPAAMPALFANRAGSEAKPRRILIADDEAGCRELLAAMLRPLGHAIDAAADGREALAKLSPETALVLLDLLMPGVDGLTALRRLRADGAFSALPVIVVTALETREDRLRAVE